MSITAARILLPEHAPTISGKVSAAPLAPLHGPTSALRAAGLRTSLFQGCAYAEDPRDGRRYVFQLQAARTGPGDVEDLRVHRFQYHDNMAPNPILTYLDTQTIVGGGHVQSAHVRISAQGNPYAWLGLEEYDRDGKQQGASLYRVRYRPDVWDLTSPTRVVKTSRKSSTVQRVYTGPGTVMAVGCPDWTIVLRRPGAEADVYEWHQEWNLLARQRDYRGSRRPAPTYAVRVPKEQADDDYQSALAQGKYNADRRRVYRITGADRILVRDSLDGKTLDLTEQAEQLLGVDHVEPEGAFTLDGHLHVAVQTDSVARRRITYLPLKW